MRARSKKRQAEYVERRKLVEQLLKERPTCETCAVFAAFDGRQLYRPRPSVDVHEILTRGRGGSILDVSNLLVVCRFPCHSRITDDSLEAEFWGLMVPSWADEEILTEAKARRDAIAAGYKHDTHPYWWDETKVGYWKSRQEADTNSVE